MTIVGLRFYLHFFNSYSKTYGSLGPVIILLLWCYVTGLAFLVGGAVNSVIEHAAAEHGPPEAKLRGKKLHSASRIRSLWELWRPDLRISG
jgi:membrane protein